MKKIAWYIIIVLSSLLSFMILVPDNDSAALPVFIGVLFYFLYGLDYIYHIMIGHRFFHSLGKELELLESVRIKHGKITASTVCLESNLSHEDTQELLKELLSFGVIISNDGGESFETVPVTGPVNAARPYSFSRFLFFPLLAALFEIIIRLQ